METGLLNAGLAAGAALAAVPIILHLVLRQKPKHLVFPALRLIRLRRRANLKKMRLRQWMLLALRMALIAILALALARPVIQGSAFIRDQEAPVAAALVFDTSYSMLYQQENKTRLERAQEIAADLLPKLPERSEIAVLDSSGTPAVLQADESGTRERVENLKPTPAAVPVTDLILEGLKTLADSPQLRKELYVFSDLAQGSWPSRQGAEIQEWAKKVDNLAIYVLAVGTKEPKNVSISSLVASEQVLPRNSELALRVTLEANGIDGDRTVELYLDDGSHHGQPVKCGEQTVTLSDGEAQEVHFTRRGLTGPVHQGFVRIVGGGDSLPFDDQRYLTLEVRPTLQVLIVADRRGDSWLWEQALSPTDLVREQRNRYECQFVTPEQFETVDLERSSVVCLINVAELPDRAWVRLREFVIEGGGLAVLAGPRLRVAQYNTAAAQEVLPGKLGGDVVLSDPPVYLNPSEFGHPVLAKFRQWEGANLAQLPVYRYLPIELARESATVIMAYNNQQPALVERRLGNGRVVLLNTSVSYRPDPRNWSDLPVGGWSFVALADQVTQYLAGNSGQQLNYEAGQTVTLRLDPGVRLADYLLITPEAQEPRRAPSPRESMLAISGVGAIGHYRVQAGPQDGGFQKGFSVNVAAEESRLEPIGRNQLDQVLGEGRYGFAEDTTGLERAIGASRVGREAFPVLMILLAGILAGEQWLANRFYRKEGE